MRKWVAWFDTRRLLVRIGDGPPAATDPTTRAKLGQVVRRRSWR